MGELGDGEEGARRVHSELVPDGDVFDSRDVIAAPNGSKAMARIAEEGRGFFLYIRGHEGRGRAPEKNSRLTMQDLDRETGRPTRTSTPRRAAIRRRRQILYDLGVRSMRL